MLDRGFSAASRSLSDSVTHGTAARIAELNARLAAHQQVIDLSIGTIDLPADARIDDGVREFIRRNPTAIHAFAPVRGFPFLRQSLAAKIKRMHGVEVDPATEILVTPGGIKGALTVMFQTFVDPGDEAIIPLPNWPHYADMLRLHRAVPKFVSSWELSEPCDPRAGPGAAVRGGLTVEDLEDNITDKTKLVVLGDCINPTGKVYTSEELRLLARVIAVHNVRRQIAGKSPIHVLFDCPYEAHVLGFRAVTFAAIEVDVPDHGTYSMRECTATLTGPGKTYGMHGDRIGYLWASPETVEMAARVQVNTNSFASTYGQIAAHLAVQEAMDDVARGRAQHARTNLNTVVKRLSRLDLLNAPPPDGGYFLFLDFSSYAPRYGRLGYRRAEHFLLHEARVAAIDGSFFGDGAHEMRHFVRLNCGRSIDLLNEACARIEAALFRLGP